MAAHGAPLTRKEKAAWIRFVVAEGRRDENAYACQRHLVALLDAVAEEGGWCACPEHVAALEGILPILWREPPPVG